MFVEFQAFMYICNGTIDNRSEELLRVLFQLFSWCCRGTLGNFAAFVDPLFAPLQTRAAADMSMDHRTRGHLGMLPPFVIESERAIR